MTIDLIKSKGATIAAQVAGSGPQVVLLHGLGTNMSAFDALTTRLPDHRVIRFDLRGHGQSCVPDGPYSMGGLIADAEAVLDHYGVKDAVVLGNSMGGLIAQGLAVKRLDLVRGMVLSATAAKLGQPDPWYARAAMARAGGMEALADEFLIRWNTPDPATRARFLTTAPEGFAANCEAIAGTDFYTPTSGLRLPTLGLCGDRDASTPPDLVRETTALIPGSTFRLVRGAGHQAPETHADVVAGHLLEFCAAIGHIQGARHTP